MSKNPAAIRRPAGRAAVALDERDQHSALERERAIVPAEVPAVPLDQGHDDQRAQQQHVRSDQQPDDGRMSLAIDDFHPAHAASNKPNMPSTSG